MSSRIQAHVAVLWSAENGVVEMERRVFRSLAYLCALGLGLWVSAAQGQQVLRIAAVVNEEIISILDLDKRLTLVIRFARMPDTANTRQRLTPGILRDLIDDKLKSQEAKRLKITVAEGQIEKALAHIQRQNGVKTGEFDAYLKRNRIDKNALIEQIKTDLTWQRVIGLQFSYRIQISDDEVDEVLAEIEQNKGKPENLISEIFLPFATAAAESDVANLANRLIQQIKSGAPFDAVARSFSQSPTAAIGGDLGWITVGQLDKTLDDAVQGITTGQISNAIRTQDGYYILLLRDRRIAAGLDKPKAETVVDLYQVHIPLPPGSPPDAVTARMQAGRNVAKHATNCDEMVLFGKESGSPLSGRLGHIKLVDLSPQLRLLIDGLPPKKPSQPMRTNDGVIVLMICNQVQAPSEATRINDHRTRVQKRLLDEQLAHAARRYLRDLRRAAFVEIRL
ncbi:MAG: peptidylprolyl isomerase [Pseudomonadota bacterium]|nr:peptidylprolyl isomerase [Pseudomonadota bacterium]